jgi:hypothetical protein
MKFLKHLTDTRTIHATTVRPPVNGISTRWRT